MLDGSGDVDWKELNSSIASYGLDPLPFQTLDKDKNGKITFQEYLETYYPLATKQELKVMKQWAYPVQTLPFFDLLELCEFDPPTSGDLEKNWRPHNTIRVTLFLQEKVDSEVHLTQTQLEELRLMFKAYDTNKNGVLERQELSKALCDCGYDPDELDELFDETDVVGFDESAIGAKA
ncbi:hypothetical protein BSKO_08421 [Bryopsis sp. KO-2023]|nr:hypothetical protein BSKO_08421 [Bryopsis sp. KO-2023]